MNECNRSTWYFGLYLFDGGGSFRFRSRGQIYVRWIVLGKLEDSFKAQTNVSYDDQLALSEGRRRLILVWDREIIYRL